MEPGENTQMNTKENTGAQQETQSQEKSGATTGSVPEQVVEKNSEGINKFFILAGIVALIIAGGIGYRVFLAPESARPVETGVERHITITTNANTWSFNPEFIEADQGDKMILTIINEDDYDHGFAIDAFGISQRMPALSTIRIEFVVTKAGDFPYYCSVSCGSGVVDGEDRGHFNQIGRIQVRSLISETVDYGEVETVDFAEETRKAAMLREADRKFVELYGVTFSELSDDGIQIDNKNTEWLKTGEVRESLKNVSYQALYIDFKEEPGLSGRSWVFIDTSTGKVIDIII